MISTSVPNALRARLSGGQSLFPVPELQNSPLSPSPKIHDNSHSLSNLLHPLIPIPPQTSHLPPDPTPSRHITVRSGVIHILKLGGVGAFCGAHLGEAGGVRCDEVEGKEDGDQVDVVRNIPPKSEFRSTFHRG